MMKRQAGSLVCMMVFGISELFELIYLQQGAGLPARNDSTCNVETAVLRKAQSHVPLDAGFFKKSAQGPQDFRFTSGQSARSIPIEEDNGHIFLRGRINGSDSLWLSLDTAASRSLIDEGLARELQLDLHGSQPITGAGGSVSGSYASGVTVSMPGVELRHQTFSTLPLDFLHSLKGRKVSAILGYDLFNRLVVEIDYVARRLNLYDPQSHEYRGPGEIIPLALHNNQPHVQAKLMLRERKPIAGEYVVDTGASSTLMLANPGKFTCCRGWSETRRHHIGN
jgi:hypothetical protein